MCSRKKHVRFAAKSDRESGLPQKVMSALTPKADMPAATTDVGYGPIAAFTSAEECRGTGATFDAGPQRKFQRAANGFKPAFSMMTVASVDDK